MKTADDRKALGGRECSLVGRASSRAVPQPFSFQSTICALRARLAGTLALPLLLLALTWVQAFPPAPHHTFYGMVRDDRGVPLDAASARVMLQTPSGRVISTSVVPGLAPGQNYQLRVPMDAGLTRELYRPTAMRPTMPFQIRVQMGRKVYLPIEVSASGQSMGEPGKATQLDLTLGEDLDGDGIPDAWERALIGRGLADDLDGVNPEDDADGDGLSNLLEYLAGSYAFDEDSAFELVIKEFKNGVPVMGFMALPGRNYEVLGSTDFEDWQQVDFRLTSDDSDIPLRSGLYSEGVTEIETEVPTGESVPAYRFFKLSVQ